MRKLFCLAMGAALLLTSCPSIAEKYDLPADPIGVLTHESVDASQVLRSDDAAIHYVRFALSDNGWADYLSVKATMHYKHRSNNETPATLSIYKSSDGKIWGKYSEARTKIIQGIGILTLTGIDGSHRESFAKEFTVGSGSSSDPFLSLKSSAEYSPRLPYVCPDTVSYQVAISDDKQYLFVKPVGAVSAVRYVGLVLSRSSNIEIEHSFNLDGYGSHYLVLGPGDMKADTWTKVEAKYCVPLTSTNYLTSTSSSYTAAKIRSEWSFHAWASTVEVKDWGTAITTYVYGAKLAASAPSAGEPTFDPLASTSRSLGAQEMCSPMLLDILGMQPEQR